MKLNYGLITSTFYVRVAMSAMFRLHPNWPDLYKYAYTQSTTFYNRGFKIQFIGYSERCPSCGKPATWISIYLYEVPTTRTIYISCPTLECQKLDIENKRKYFDFIDLYKIPAAQQSPNMETAETVW